MKNSGWLWWSLIPMVCISEDDWYSVFFLRIEVWFITNLVKQKLHAVEVTDGKKQKERCYNLSCKCVFLFVNSYALGLLYLPATFDAQWRVTSMGPRGSPPWPSSHHQGRPVRPKPSWKSPNITGKRGGHGHTHSRVMVEFNAWSLWYQKTYRWLRWYPDVKRFLQKLDDIRMDLILIGLGWAAFFGVGLPDICVMFGLSHSSSHCLVHQLFLGLLLVW